MKRLFLLMCVMLSAMLTFAQNTKKVAILEVADREGRLSYSQKLILRSSMARAVSNTDGYEAYDRSDVDMIMSEQDFQRTGLVSESEIRKLGEMTGVSLILVTEGVLTGTNSVFVSAKILNVETAKVEIMENINMGLDASAMQDGCAQLARRLFGVTASCSAMEKFNIERMGPNNYIYMGKYMEKKEYEYFLKNNCPKAYGQYKLGKQLIASGWGTFIGGFAMLGAGMAVYFCVDGRAGVSGGAALMGVGSLISVAAGIPLLSIGYSRRNNAYDTYNNNCASSSAEVLSLNLISGQNGLGIAMNF